MRIFGVVASSYNLPPTPQKGYMIGGINVGFTETYDSVDIFSFDTETYSAGSNVATASGRYQPASVANFDVAGYSVGGSTTSAESAIIHKVLFTNDSISTVNNSLVGRYRAEALSNSGTAGYIVGGFDASTSLKKLNFSTESHTEISNSITAISWGAGVSNHQVAGYTMGGAESASVRVNKIYKLNFSSEAISLLGATMSYAGRGLASGGTGIHNAGQAGYAGGGASSAGLVTTIDKLNFSNETRSTLSATLETAKNHVVGLSKSGTAGYLTLGLDAVNGVYVTSGRKISFSNDTGSSTPTATGFARYGSSSISNSV